jgi:hypothetical protein
VTVRDQPAAVLTHHFFTSLFDFGVLSEEGSEALKRVLLGALALAIAAGLLLTRVFMAKYGELSAASPEAYAREIIADHAFLIAVPMWIVASAMALVGQSLFPDETDFRILMAEPLSRSLVFGAKLAALLLFGGLFIVGAHAGLFPLAALTLIGAFKTGTFVPAAAAFVVSSLAASLFAALAILAVHGLLVLLASRTRLLVFSSAVRMILIAGLVLALPLLSRLPATAGSFAADAWWLPWAPPAWFAGLERWLLGDTARAALAAQAVLALAVAAGITVVAYVRLYSRFDRVTFQSAGPAPGRRVRPSSDGTYRGAPVRGAVQRFVTLTIRRSVLHQGLVMGALAGAGGLVLNSLLNADWRTDRLDAATHEGLVWTLLWTPMTMVFLAVPAVRLALSVPLDLRANWIFRMTEEVDARVDVADAGVRTVLLLAVALPIAAAMPLQWWVMGAGVGGVVPVEGAIGWLLVEIQMADWHRVPFTCSYIPGKGFFPQMCVKAFAWYVVFTFATGLMLRGSLRDPRAAVVLSLGFAIAAALLHVRRARRARQTNLIFEEQLPTELTPLRLSPE